MGKNQSASNLTNIIKQDANGNISFVSGSTTLMSVSSSGAIETTGNVAGTASYASNAELFDGLDSTVFTLTSSFAAFTASQNILNGTYATTGSNTFTGIQTVNSNLIVTGSITAQTLVVQTITSSVDFVTGSTRFGSLSSDTHVFTGSVNITGSTNLAGSLTVNKVAINSGNLNLASFPSLDLIVSGGIGFSSGGSGAAALVNRDGSGNITFYGGTGDIKFTDVTMTSNYLIIKSAGNVGIGTVSPNRKFSVNGDITATDSTNNWDMVIRATSTESSIRSTYSGAGGFNPMTFYTTDTKRMQIYATGEVAIIGAAATEAAWGLIVNEANNNNFIIYAGGSGTATKGIILKTTTGTTTINALALASSGLATFSSNGGNLAIFKTNNATDSYNSAVILAGNADATQANRNAYILLDPNGANGTGTDYAFFTALGTGETQFGTSKSDGFLALYTADTAKMRITSAGNVGIGTSFVISSYFAGAQTGGVLQVATNVAKTATANSYPVGFFSSNDATYPLGLYIGIITGASTGARKLKLQGTEIGVSPNDIVMQTDGARVGIGTSSPSYKLHTSYDGCGDYVAQFHNVNSGDCGGSGVLILQGGTFNSSGDTTSRYISFRRGDGTEIGAVRRNGASNVAFDSSSDYRLKEDLKDFNGLDKISAIKVYDFQWKNTTDRMNGVLAHELQEVIPYAVGGEKDGIDGKGDMIIQGVDYSKLVPVLIKSIQELKVENDTLKEILQRNNIQ